MIEDELRIIFERKGNPDVQFGFRRSRRGFYINPSVARDWKWFKAGALAMLLMQAKP